MFENLRIQQKLSRVDLANRTGRSVGYILKAEQATFPSPPVALINYWVDQGQSQEILVSAYYDFQRRKRETWLDLYEPVILGGEINSTIWLPFRRKWVQRRRASVTGARAVGSFWDSDGKAKKAKPNYPPVGSFWEPEEIVYSSSYGISTGLCLPAAVIYRNDKDLTKAGAIRDAMEDLVEYVSSGRSQASNFDNAPEEEEAILRIAKEEGWKPLPTTKQQPNSLAS